VTLSACHITKRDTSSHADNAQIQSESSLDYALWNYELENFNRTFR